MKSSSIPSSSNNSEVESYEDYKERKVKFLVERTKDILINIHDSSLKEEDKDKMRYELMKMFIL